MPFKFFAATMLALLLAACNPVEQLDIADEQIATFHEVYNQGDIAALYALTGAEFREVTSKEQMEDLHALVTDRMGAIESSERSGFNVNSTDGQTIGTVTMTTQFEKGEGIETFTFYGTGENTRLVAWNVDSPNFMEIPGEVVTPVEEQGATESQPTD